MNTPHTIVVGYDGSPDARAALEATIAHVHTDSTVHVVTVHDPRLDSYSSAVLPDEFRFAGDDEMTDLLRLSDAELHLESAGVRHRSHLRWGRPAREILEVADGVDADLIVLGSRGLAGMQRWLLGSVSTKVSRNAPDRTVIVHDEGKAAA